MKKTTTNSPDITPGPWNSKRNLLIDASVILAVAIIIGLVWWVGHRPKTEPSTKDTPKSIIHQALNTRDGVGSIKLEAALKNNPTKEEKQQLLQLLANDAQKRGDFQATVNYLQQSYNGGLKTANLAQSIGTLYKDKLDNKPEALKYFKLGAESAAANTEGDPFAHRIKTYLDQQIKELEDQGVKAAK